MVTGCCNHGTCRDGLRQSLFLESIWACAGGPQGSRKARLKQNLRRCAHATRRGPLHPAASLMASRHHCASKHVTKLISASFGDFHSFSNMGRTFKLLAGCSRSCKQVSASRDRQGMSSRAWDVCYFLCSVLSNKYVRTVQGERGDSCCGSSVAKKATTLKSNASCRK